MVSYYTHISHGPIHYLWSSVCWVTPGPIYNRWSIVVLISPMSPSYFHDLMPTTWAHSSTMVYYNPWAHISWTIANSLKPPLVGPFVMVQIHWRPWYNAQLAGLFGWIRSANRMMLFMRSAGGLCCLFAGWFGAWWTAHAGGWLFTLNVCAGG